MKSCGWCKTISPPWSMHPAYSQSTQLISLQFKKKKIQRTSAKEKSTLFLMFTDVLMLHSNANSMKMFSGLSPTWMTSQRLGSFSRTPVRLFNSKANGAVLHKRMYLYREGFYFSASRFTEDLKTTFNSAVASLNSHLRLSARSSNQL